MTNKLKIGIIGATGYTGAELIRLLIDHPQAEIKCLTTTSVMGQDISDIYPSLRQRFSHKLTEYKSSDIKGLDIVFIALPHGKSMEIVPEILAAGARVVDLGADFRFSDVALYENTYQKHTAPEVNSKAVYGLPEMNREKIKKASLIANPGCYVTSATLALKPIIDSENFVKDSIIIDAKSGTSGAGRSLAQNTHFTETYANFSAYKIGAHRHQPEIEQNLGGVKVVFTPHLLPVNRGILSTIYVKLSRKTEKENILDILRKAYKNEPFVKIVDNPPTLKDVVGSNYCIISPTVNNDQLVLVSVLDNLIKGASGQAIQNMNIMFGLEETMGLERVALNP